MKRIRIINCFIIIIIIVKGVFEVKDVLLGSAPVTGNNLEFEGEIIRKIVLAHVNGHPTEQ